MNVQINFVNLSAVDQLNHFIKKKIKKLFLVTNSLISADIYLKIDKPKSHNNKVVEIKLHSKLGIFFAKKKYQFIRRVYCFSFESSKETDYKKQEKINFQFLKSNLLLKKVFI